MFKYGIITQSKGFSQNYKNNAVEYLSREFNRLITKKDVVF
jgi:hypothetical protein